MVNSFFPWIGGKKLMRDIILERFPLQYNKYIEVFGGAGWILFAKEPEEFEVYNDANSNLTNMFYVVKNRPIAFLEELGFLPLNSKDEFEILLDWHKRKDFTLPYYKEELDMAKHYISPPQYEEYKAIMNNKATMGDIKRAAIFYKLIRYSYAASGTSFNGQPINIAQTFQSIWLANRRLNENGVKSKDSLSLAEGKVGKGVIIQNKSFEAIIELYDNPLTFFYLDPPYYGTEKYYEAMFSKEQHYMLYEKLKNIKGYFMLSYNDCDFIRDLYKEFNIECFERLNSISQRYSPGNTFRELIITNYNPYERKNNKPKQLSLI